jgi:hypothetical protein
MSRSRLLFVCLALLVPALAPAAASAAEPIQWTVNNNVGPVKAATEYELVNVGGGSRIGYESRTGVDLAWTSSGGNFEFRRGNPRDHRSLRPDEPVAIYNTKTKRYLYYSSQSFGINLDWSSSPMYQWKIQQSGSRFSLYNTATRDYVVYGTRTWGINLVWAGMTGAGDGIKQLSVSLTYAGTSWWHDGAYYRLFGGATGLDDRDLMRTVQNASGDTQNFIKCDVNGSCTLTNAVMFGLAPGATMSAEQMKTAYGTDNPKVPAKLYTWIKDPSPITQTYMNISYIDR